MLRSLESLKCIKGDAGSLEIQPRLQGEVIEVMFDLQVF
jgi:hypothetical protein